MRQADRPRRAAGPVRQAAHFSSGEKCFRGPGRIMVNGRPFFLPKQEADMGKNNVKSLKITDCGRINIDFGGGLCYNSVTLRAVFLCVARKHFFRQL